MSDSTLQEREHILTDPAYVPGIVRHIVLFRYRKDLTSDELTQIEERFHQLSASDRDGRRYILSIESGAQNSNEGLGQGFVHAFIVSFASQGERNYYVGKPLISDPALFDARHQEFKTFIGEYLESPDGVLVFDFQPGI